MIILGFSIKQKNNKTNLKLAFLKFLLSLLNFAYQYFKDFLLVRIFIIYQIKSLALKICEGYHEKKDCLPLLILENPCTSMNSNQPFGTTL